MTANELPKPTNDNESLSDAVRILCRLTGEPKPTDDLRMDHLCDVAKQVADAMSYSFPHWAIPALERSLGTLSNHGYADTDLAALRDWIADHSFIARLAPGPELHDPMLIADMLRQYAAYLCDDTLGCYTLASLNEQADLIETSVGQAVTGVAPGQADPYVYVLEAFDDDGTPWTEYSKNNKFSGGRRGGKPLYDYPAPKLPAQPEAVAAKPLTWIVEEEGKSWNDDKCGLWIEFDNDTPDETHPYMAGWGEGDESPCATLEEAKQWCQDQVDDWVKLIAYAAPARQADGRNYAAEWGEYLAKDAESLLEAINAHQLACGEDGDEHDPDEISNAEESLRESVTRVRRSIYEFRKRANRPGAEGGR